MEIQTLESEFPFTGLLKCDGTGLLKCKWIELVIECGEQVSRHSTFQGKNDVKH